MFPDRRNLPSERLEPREPTLPYPDEADSTPGAPDSPPAGSFSPDTTGEPVELQSPEGQLPYDETPPDEPATGPDTMQPDETEANATLEGDATAGRVRVDDDAEAGPPLLLLGTGALPAADELPVEAQRPAGDESPPADSQAPEGVPFEPPVVKEVRHLPRAEREKVERERRRFAACGRCGYFVADCCLMLGEEAVQDAILDADDGWLRLEGDLTFRRLLQNAYGIQLDAGYDYFDGACPECRRRFVFMEQADGPTRLKIRTSKTY